MRMGRKRSSAKGAATVWWLVALVVALFCGWLAWHVWHAPKSAALPNASTNRIDAAKAPNLLGWLNTNTMAPGTNLATKPVIPPPPTNRIVENHRFPLPTTNIVTVRTAAPPLFKPPTNVATAPATNSPPIERPVKNLLEAQIALARLAISAGPIDGLDRKSTRLNPSHVA